jgi:uncharacterized membrane protein YfcA
MGLGIGTWGGRRLSPVQLQKGFALLIIALAGYIIIRNLAYQGV